VKPNTLIILSLSTLWDKKGDEAIEKDGIIAVKTVVEN